MTKGRGQGARWPTCLLPHRLLKRGRGQKSPPALSPNTPPAPLALGKTKELEEMWWLMSQLYHEFQNQEGSIILRITVEREMKVRRKGFPICAATFTLIPSFHPPFLPSLLLVPCVHLDVSMCPLPSFLPSSFHRRVLSTYFMLSIVLDLGDTASALMELTVCCMCICLHICILRQQRGSWSQVCFLLIATSTPMIPGKIRLLNRIY